jgi:hypothetical protein
MNPLPYLADRLGASNERRKKAQNARSSSGSASAGQGHSKTNEGPGQVVDKGLAAGNTRTQQEHVEISSAAKENNPRARAKNNAGQKNGKDVVNAQDIGQH